MEERRRLERFEINSPARVLVHAGSDKEAEYNLTTRDVSSAGAFLFSSQPLPQGTSVRMEFVISLDTLQRLAGDKGRAKVKVKGEVIRSDANGIAIRFDNRYKITALENTYSKNSLS